MMTKLSRSALFCNDINLKSIIGIDVCDDDHLLITCRSYVKRFNIKEKTEDHIWIVKSWNPFLTKAVKVPQKDKVCAVLNDSTICVWELQDLKLNNVKTFKSFAPVHGLLKHNNFLYIVYKNGQVYPYSFIQSNKSKISQNTYEILNYEALEGSETVVIFIKNENGSYSLLSVDLDTQTPNIIFIIEKKLGLDLTGSLLMSNGNLITTWSNGEMYCRNTFSKSSVCLELPTSQLDFHSPYGYLMEDALSNVVENKAVQISTLSSRYVLLHGMEKNEESSLLVLYNLDFGTREDEKQLKMYSDPPQSWSLPLSCDRLGVLASNGTALLFFSVSATQTNNTASMIGCRSLGKVTPIYHAVNWISSKSQTEVIHLPFMDGISKEFKQFVTTLNVNSSCDDRVIKLVTEAAVERGQTSLVSECILAFDSMPEEALLSALIFIMNADESDFSQDSSTLNGLNGNATYTKNGLLNMLLCKPFNTNNLLQAMHVQMNFKESRSLFYLLHSLLMSEKSTLIHSPSAECDIVPVVEVLTSWLCVLLDASYHDFLTDSDPQIHIKFEQCLNVVASMYQTLKSFEKMDYLLRTLGEKKKSVSFQYDVDYDIKSIAL